MEIDRQGPGEELNLGTEETVPRPAATVIVLRGAAAALEVLPVQRNQEARFMGGAWVFPGGAVDRDEGHGDAALRAAAVREVAEEAGIRLPAPEQLVPFSRWITTAQVKIRFDTWFYLAPLPEGSEPRVDGEEVVDARWYEPAAALEAAADGQLLLVFPTKASRAALGLRVLRSSARLRAEPRDPPGRASRRDVGRAGARAATRRAWLRRVALAP
ncbi:MAG TPA: NUDIX hydrolase [Solirubrobacteraceae bacterium]